MIMYFAALNLMLCYYAISDRDKLKKTFQRTLQISTGIEDEDRYYPTVVSTHPRWSYAQLYTLMVHTIG